MELLLFLPVAFAAFCVWITVRIINRGERWTKRTAAIIERCILAILFASPFLLIGGLIVAPDAPHIVERPFVAVIDYLFPSLGCKSGVLVSPLIAVTFGGLAVIVGLVLFAAHKRNADGIKPPAPDPDAPSESN